MVLISLIRMQNSQNILVLLSIDYARLFPKQWRAPAGTEATLCGALGNPLMQGTSVGSPWASDSLAAGFPPGTSFQVLESPFLLRFRSVRVRCRVIARPLHRCSVWGSRGAPRSPCRPRRPGPRPPTSARCTLCWRPAFRPENPTTHVV